MSELNETLSKEITALKRMRDELRLQLHLAKKEAVQQFERLEDTWREIETKTAELGRASGESVKRLTDKTRILMDEVREDYRDIRRSFSDKGEASMKVAELMAKDVVTCTPEDSLAHAAQIMWDHDCGCVPVVDASRHVLAIITDRDICMAAYTQGKELSAIPVGAAMSHHLYSCKPYDTVGAAEGVMWMRQVRRVPVTDETGHLVGILSLNDIARHMQGREGAPASGLNPETVALTLAAISEPPAIAEYVAAE